MARGREGDWRDWEAVDEFAEALEAKDDNSGNL
jgi:hypothetical protein